MKKTNQILKEAVKLIMNGEYEKACRIIFNCEVKKDIINYFVRRGRDSDDALYIFEDGLFVFLDIVKKGNLKDNENLGGFLFKICRNISKRSLLLKIKIEAEKKQFEKEYPDIILSESDNSFGLQNYAKKAINAFMSLGIQCRKIIKLKYILKYSHETISEKMKYKTDVSKAMLYNCMKELFKRMDQMPSDISDEDLEGLRNNLEKDED